MSAALTVATFNIKFGLEAHRAARELALAARFRRPDLLLLQEMDPAGVRVIARELGMGHVYAPASVHAHHNKPFGQAILSPWPLCDVDVVALPHRQPLNRQRRNALACTAVVAGQPVRVCNVHLETVVMPAGKRLAQAAAALGTVADFDGPVVVGGDFNTAGRRCVSRLERLGQMLGLDRVRGLAPTADWTALGLRLGRFRLDHVLYRGLELRGAAVRETRASDHRPVWVDFAVPAPTAAATPIAV